MAHTLILWTPTIVKIRRGRQQFSFIEALQLQTGLEDIDELRYVIIAVVNGRKSHNWVERELK